MKKKILIIFLTIIIIFYVFIIVYKEYNQDILILGGNTIVKYKNGHITEIQNTLKIDKRYNYQKFYVYTDEGIFKNYYMNFYKGEYFGDVAYDLYSDSMEKENITNKLLAYKGNLNISVANTISTTEMTENDKKIIKEKLYSYEYDINSLNFNKITVDLNKDGNNEEIYIINNFNSIDTDNTIFNYVFMKKKDNTIIDIEKNENSSSEYYAVQNSSFLYATDIDNDNNYEIVLYSYYEESPAYCTIYKYDDLNNTVTKFE